MCRWLCRIALVASAVGIAGCHISGNEPEPFNPEAATVSELNTAEANPRPPMHPLPTTLQSPYVQQPTTQRHYPPTTGRSLDNGPTVRMTLHEIIQRAVANSLDVKVAGYQPAMDEARVVEAEANFDPTFFTNLTYSDQQTLTPTATNIAVAPGQQYIFRSWSLQTGVKQNLETGGQLQLMYDPTQTHESLPSGSGPIRPNPFWTSDIAVQLTQPLLQNFGYDVNQARIVIARNNQQISLLEFRNQLEKTLRDIEDNYWQLVAAEGDVTIANQLLSATLKTSDVLIKRRGQDVTRVEISQTNSAVESRRAALISARAKVRDFSDQLKRLMDDPEIPVAGPTLILPSTVPLEEPVKMNLQDQISTALQNRFDLGEQILRMDSTTAANQVAKNNLLPQLNIVGSYGFQGFAGDWSDAVDNQFSFDHPSWSLGLQFQIPIGNRAARAIWRRTLLQREQAITQYKDTVDQVSLEVKTAWRDVSTKWQEMEAARAARFAAADALKAVEQREEGGEPLTYTFVQLKLDTQQSYASAQDAEVQAISDYNRALMKLEFAKGTLLRYNNVVMEEAPIHPY